MAGVILGPGGQILTRPRTTTSVIPDRGALLSFLTLSPLKLCGSGNASGTGQWHLNCPVGRHGPHATPGELRRDHGPAVPLAAPEGCLGDELGLPGKPKHPDSQMLPAGYPGAAPCTPAQSFPDKPPATATPEMAKRFSGIPEPQSWCTWPRLGSANPHNPPGHAPLHVQTWVRGETLKSTVTIPGDQIPHAPQRQRGQ